MDKPTQHGTHQGPEGLRNPQFDPRTQVLEAHHQHQTHCAQNMHFAVQPSFQPMNQIPSAEFSQQGLRQSTYAMHPMHFPSAWQNQQGTGVTSVNSCVPAQCLPGSAQMFHMQSGTHGHVQPGQFANSCGKLHRSDNQFLHQYRLGIQHLFINHLTLQFLLNLRRS